MDEYTLDINGVPHTFLLDADHAERLGATRVKAKAAVADKARQPANKARTPENK